MIRVLVVSVVPSPYQRDIFRALAARPEVDLNVCYMEAELRGYPWPQQPMADYEKVLSGGGFDNGKIRVHWNWGFQNASDYDVVIFNTYLTSISAQWMMRKFKKRPKWVFWGERLRPQSGAIRRKIQGLIANVIGGAAGIAAIGKLAVDDYAMRFPNTPIFNIPYHCSLEEFRRSSIKNRDRSSATTFLFCGVMNERKGVDVLLQAFDRLVLSGCNANLLLVGQEGGLSRFLASLSTATRSRIQYAGFQSPQELPGFFSKADVFVLPSRHDGWGVVMNQALGSGLSLIGSLSAGASHDLIVPGKNGLIFRSGDVDGLFNSLKAISSDPTMASEFGQNSMLMSEDWTPEAGANKWVSALKQIVGHD